MRGEVWDVAAPRVGTHPAVVLTVNALRERLAEVTVAIVTGTPGPRSIRIPIGAEAGATGYAESYIDATSLHTVPLSRFHSRRGLLAHGELTALENAVRLVLGL
jgi:mRNA interferase MazF